MFNWELRFQVLSRGRRTHMGRGEEEMVPLTPGSCGVGEAMPRPPLCKGYSLGYSMQETVPKPPAQVWRMLTALVVGKDEAPSPTSLREPWRVEEKCLGLWGGCSLGRCRLEAEGECSPPEGIMNMVSSLPTPNPGQGRYLESRGVMSFTHNIIKKDSGAGWGLLAVRLSH